MKLINIIVSGLVLLTSQACCSTKPPPLGYTRFKVPEGQNPETAFQNHLGEQLAALDLSNTFDDPWHLQLVSKALEYERTAVSKLVAGTLEIDFKQVDSCGNKEPHFLYKKPTVQSFRDRLKSQLFSSKKSSTIPLTEATVYRQNYEEIRAKGVPLEGKGDQFRLLSFKAIDLGIDGELSHVVFRANHQSYVFPLLKNDKLVSTRDLKIPLIRKGEDNRLLVEFKRSAGDFLPLDVFDPEDSKSERGRFDKLSWQIESYKDLSVTVPKNAILENVAKKIVKELDIQH